MEAAGGCLHAWPPFSTGNHRKDDNIPLGSKCAGYRRIGHPGCGRHRNYGGNRPISWPAKNNVAAPSRCLGFRFVKWTHLASSGRPLGGSLQKGCRVAYLVNGQSTTHPSTDTETVKGAPSPRQDGTPRRIGVLKGMEKAPFKADRFVRDKSQRDLLKQAAALSPQRSRL